MWHWLAHHLGTDNGAGGYYLFWSGFGANFAEFALLAGAWKVFNCHEFRCWRIGTKMTVEDNGHHFRRCKRHHDLRHA